MCKVWKSTASDSVMELTPDTFTRKTVSQDGRVKLELHRGSFIIEENPFVDQPEAGRFESKLTLTIEKVPCARTLDRLHRT